MVEETQDQISKSKPRVVNRAHGRRWRLERSPSRGAMSARYSFEGRRAVFAMKAIGIAGYGV
jgi:hypothetical protein